MQHKFDFAAVGVVHTCFTEKFGVPRQAGLVPVAKAFVELLPPYNVSDALSDLKGVSHVWLLFAFHLNPIMQKWKPKVRPPRFGGNKSLGVFATRSPVRPNPIGLSAVKLLNIENNGIWVAGVDMVDGTPVLDIKPYVPYTDSLPEATNTIASQAPVAVEVIFSESAKMFCETAQPPELENLIIQVLSLDPRPQYHPTDNQRVYGVSLYKKNIRWKFQSPTQIIVLDIAG